MPEVECKNLSFSYPLKGNNNTVEVFKDLNIKFENHKFNVLLGESGSGKTTLLNIIAGIQNQYDGQLTFDGKDVASRWYTPLIRSRRERQIMTHCSTVWRSSSTIWKLNLTRILRPSAKDSTSSATDPA